MKQKKLTLDRIVGKRGDNDNEYLQIKPSGTEPTQTFNQKSKATKTDQNIKKNKWHY